MRQSMLSEVRQGGMLVLRHVEGREYQAVETDRLPVAGRWWKTQRGAMRNGHGDELWFRDGDGQARMGGWWDGGEFSCCMPQEAA